MEKKITRIGFESEKQQEDVVWFEEKSIKRIDINKLTQMS